MLHAYLYVPDGYELLLICVDSGCTVTSIDHGSIIPKDRRMPVSRPISVATKDSEAIYPATTKGGGASLLLQILAALSMYSWDDVCVHQGFKICLVAPHWLDMGA